MSEPACDCPPPAQRVPEVPADPRVELLRMAKELVERYSPRLLNEYLRLRRNVR